MDASKLWPQNRHWLVVGADLLLNMHSGEFLICCPVPTLPHCQPTFMGVSNIIKEMFMMTKKQSRYCVKCNMGKRRQLTNNDRKCFWCEDHLWLQLLVVPVCQCDTVTRAGHQVTMMANVKFHHQHHHRPVLCPWRPAHSNNNNDKAGEAQRRPPSRYSVLWGNHGGWWWRGWWRGRTTGHWG